MRTQFKTFIAATVAALAVSAFAQAPQWPSKPIRVINAGPAGSPPDTYSRMYAERLGKVLGVPVVIENKPGAGNNISSDLVAKAPADGYTLLYTVANSFVMNPYIYPKLPFDVDKDFVPVAPLLAQGQFIVVNNNLQVRTLSELVDMARQRPGQLAYASYGTGGYPHLAMELLSDAAKIQMMHVPYKAGPMTDVIGGQVQLLAEPAASAIPMIQQGKVRAIAYLGPKRHPQFPDLPAVAETYPGVIAYGWHGIWAPANTPKHIVQRLNAELVAITRSPDLTKRIIELGSDPLSATPQEMADMIEKDARQWSGLIRAKNIRLE
jgi:tripartite-type tricarboxylate transporter receptor subunit TctC